MVEVVRRRAAAAGADNLEACVMDMERLEFADGSFDAVTCRWGYMFCPDVVGALAESRRVLRPGGRLSLAVWDVPAKNAWLTGIVDAINDVAPAATPADPKALGPFRLCDRHELEGFMRAAGFASPRSSRCLSASTSIRARRGGSSSSISRRRCATGSSLLMRPHRRK